MAADSSASASSFTRRTARLADLPAIVDIYNSTVASRQVTADTSPISIASREAWFAEHNPERRPMWVVPDDANPDAGILGWLSFSDFNTRPAYGGSAELSIYLRQDARGRGLGRYLLSEAMRFAPQIEVHSLVGLIFGHNVPSLRLFEGAGFERWGFLPGVATLDGVERDLVIVGKRVA
jgi:L-amino acid N-acyltransferase YncA